MPPEQIAALEALGGDDDRLRAKLERTQRNNANVILRARRVAAINEKAREEAARLAEEEVESSPDSRLQVLNEKTMKGL